MGYIAELAVELGIATWLLIVILVWTLTWKLMAMWKSAKNSHLVWFIVLAIFNTVGILPILYIYIFSEIKDFKKNNMKSKKKTSKKKPVKKPKKK